MTVVDVVLCLFSFPVSQCFKRDLAKGALRQVMIDDTSVTATCPNVAPDIVEESDEQKVRNVEITSVRFEPGQRSLGQVGERTSFQPTISCILNGIIISNAIYILLYFGVEHL